MAYPDKRWHERITTSEALRLFCAVALKNAELVVWAVSEQAELAENRFKHVAGFRADGDHRQAEVFVAAAEERENGLDGGRTGLDEVS